MTKYEDITVYWDGKKDEAPEPWLDISDISDLFYLSFSGRLYFSLENPSEVIVDLTHDDERQSISFRYIGWWEDEYSREGGEDVDYLFEVVFKNVNDYQEIKLTWIRAEKIHPKEELLEGFEINKFLAVKLINNKTFIYVNGRRFRQCIQLLFTIPKKEVHEYDQINSIDEAADIFKKSLDDFRSIQPSVEISAKEELWGHYSNLQVWFEHDYDTRLLHSNLSFPLLAELVKAGDPLAKKVITQEIFKRIESGNPTVILYLINQGFVKYLLESNVQMNILEGNQELEDFLKENSREFRFSILPIYHFLIQIGDSIAKNEFKSIIREKSGTFTNLDIISLIKFGYEEYLPPDFWDIMINKVQNNDREATKLMLWYFQRYVDHQQERILSEQLMEQLVDILSTIGFDHPIQRLGHEEQGLGEEEYMGYFGEIDDDEYYEIEHDFDFWYWRDHILKALGSRISGPLKKRIIKIVHSEKWQALADLINQYLLHYLNEKDFLDLIRNPQLNFLENLLVTFQTTHLKEELLSKEWSLYDELKWFPHDSLKRRLIDILSTRNKDMLETVIESSLLKLFSSLELSTFFENEEASFFGTVHDTLIKEYDNGMIIKWYQKMVRESPEFILRAIRAFILEKNYVRLLQFIECGGIHYMDVAFINEFLTDYDFIGELMNAIKAPEVQKFEIIHEIGDYLEGKFIAIVKPNLISKMEELLQKENEEKIMDFMNLGFLMAFNDEELLEFFNKGRECLFLSLNEAKQTDLYFTILSFVEKHESLISNQLKILLIDLIRQDKKTIFEKCLEFASILVGSDLDAVLQHPILEGDYLTMLIERIEHDIGDIFQLIDSQTVDALKQKGIRS